MVDKINYLSQDGLEKLKAELQDLKMVKRREIANKIENAKALGDLSENAEYHDAKDQLAFVEGRVQEIEHVLKNVELIEAGASTTVRVGSSVTVDVGGKEKSFTIVGSNEADPIQGRISNESPLGSAFLGHAQGDQVSVTTPAGTQTYTIKKIG